MEYCVPTAMNTMGTPSTNPITGGPAGALVRRVEFLTGALRLTLAAMSFCARHPIEIGAGLLQCYALEPDATR